MAAQRAGLKVAKKVAMKADCSAVLWVVWLAAWKAAPMDAWTDEMKVARMDENFRARPRNKLKGLADSGNRFFLRARIGVIAGLTVNVDYG